MKLQGMSIEELHLLGLDVHEIYVHQERIQTSMERRGELFIPIQETCRLDNQGVLPTRYLKEPESEALHGFVAFVPAAGAASRYFKPLHELRLALESGEARRISKELAQLRRDGGAEWPLPPHLTQSLSDESRTSWSEEERLSLIEEIDLPKALLPSWKDGPSFLHVKQMEHQAINGLDAQVFVAPLEASATFREHLASAPSELPTSFLEQGPSMSTLRFLPSGLPYRDPEAQLSIVPAGHGMLVKLLPEIHKQYPRAHSLLIRNIDNVNGQSPEVIAATDLFLRQHQTVLMQMKAIRRAVHSDQWEEASRQAHDLLENFKNLRQTPDQAWLRDQEEPWRPLWAVLLQIFHCPTSLALRMQTQYQDKKALRMLYERPLNTLGQVPNSGKDIGGSPVFAKSEAGEVSICLELPHVSPADRQRFLEDPKQATHFNPVFVAAEIPEHHHAYEIQNCPFWILAEKTFHGQPVVYHEIVLYEVLGNSLTANVLFPEIPRILFNPHKTLLDGLKPRN